MQTNINNDKIKELKQKLISQSVNENKELTLSSMKRSSLIFYFFMYYSFPLFLVVLIISIVNQSFWLFLASLFYEYILICNYRSFKNQKTKQNIKNENYQELFENLKLQDIKGDYFATCVKYNEALFDLIKAIKQYNLPKKDANMIFANVLQETGKENLKKLLLEEDMIAIQYREKSVTSAIYVYALLMKVEEFAKKEIFEYNPAKVISNYTQLKKQHEFILNSE